MGNSKRLAREFLQGDQDVHGAGVVLFEKRPG